MISTSLPGIGKTRRFFIEVFTEQAGTNPSLPLLIPSKGSITDGFDVPSTVWVQMLKLVNLMLMNLVVFFGDNLSPIRS